MLADLVLHRALVLTMEPGSQPLPQGYVALAGGKIAAVGQAEEPDALPPARAYYDVQGQLLLPGLVNCHCHAAMTLFRGLADDLPLLTWLTDYIFPAERRWVTEELVYWGTLLAAAELIRGGVTCVADAYFQEAAARRALAAAGLRAVTAQGVIDFPAPGVPDPTANLKAAEDFMQQGAACPPELITSTLFCHAPYTCQAATLQGAKDLTRRHGLPFFIHLAETQEEGALLRQRTGKSPTAYLESLGLLDEQTVVVHAIWLTEADQELLARRGVKVCHCPESNLKLAAGVAPVAALLQRGLTVGLGTDGPASNNNLDLFGEMSLAARLAKVNTGDPTVLPAWQVVELATCGGAAVLGLEKVIGTITPGKAADLIILDLQQPHLTPLFDPYSHLVYAARPPDVRGVLVQGRWLLQDRRLVTVAWPEVRIRVRELAAAIGQDLGRQPRTEEH